MLEFLKKYIEKIKNYDFLQGDCLTCTDEDKIPAVNMPFFRLAFGSFNSFVDNIRQFAVLGICFSVILSALSFVFGFSYLCGFIGGMENALFCSGSQILYVFYFFVKIVVLSVFAVLWCQVVFCGEKLTLKSIFSVGKRDVKFSLILFLTLLLNFVPLLSYYLLSIRIPNPDWRVEISYFAVVSVGFLVPFVVLRFYSVLGFIGCGEKVPSLKEIWLKSRGNTLKILLSLFLIFILLIMIINNFYGGANINMEDSLLFTAISSEFFYNLLFLIILVLWVNNCCLQKKYLFEQEDEKK